MLTTQDHQEIAELVARYNWAIDHCEAVCWADTFTENGVLAANGVDLARGRQELIAHVALRRAAGTPIVRHWVTNLRVTGEEDSARLTAYVMAFILDHGLGAPAVMGEYADDLVRLDGRWLFRTRRLTVVAGATVKSSVHANPLDETQ